MSTEIADKVKAIMVEHMEFTPDQVTENANFVKDLDMDSLDAMDLIVVMNETFDIDIPAPVVERLQTVGDLIKAVEDLVNVPKV